MALIVNVHNYAGTRDTLSASIDRSPARYGLDLVSAGARCNVPAIVERIEAGDIVHIEQFDVTVYLADVPAGTVRQHWSA